MRNFIEGGFWIYLVLGGLFEKEDTIYLYCIIVVFQQARYSWEWNCRELFICFLSHTKDSIWANVIPGLEGHIFLNNLKLFLSLDIYQQFCTKNPLIKVNSWDLETQLPRPPSPRGSCSNTKGSIEYLKYFWNISFGFCEKLDKLSIYNFRISMAKQPTLKSLKLTKNAQKTPRNKLSDHLNFMVDGGSW